jgi:exosome complex exonuclease RRP6
MQISSIRQDYVIDFLHSASHHSTNFEFTRTVSKVLAPVVENRKVMKIMHGCDNDLVVIRSILGLNFVNFVDTARVDMEIHRHINIRGLAVLVKEYLREHVNKDYQVSEWRIRPIPNSMLDYSRRDSFVLLSLAEVMLNSVPEEKLREVLMNSCRFARRNRKHSQPLIRNLEAV